ncbi:MAG: hypothetical protein ABII90_12585 [Bacteroidota bacterium]
MNSAEIGFIFPAFVNEFIGTEKDIVSKHSDDFDILLKNAADLVDSSLINFDIKTNNFLTDELKIQFITYVFSCCISNILKKRNIITGYTAGYSMGLYAALYHCNSITFEDGLLLIKNAFNIIKNSTCNKKFGMGTVVGLDYHDMSKIISQNSNNVENISTNSSHNFVISGDYYEVDKILNIAKEEGALYVRLLPVTCPYHSKFTGNAADEFGNYVKRININAPCSGIVSLIDQNILKTADDIKKELAGNLNTGINWLNTMLKMIDLNVNIFIECGAGKTLYKIGKFIEGDFKIYSINKLDEFINDFAQT